MPDWISFEKNPQHIAREKLKARKLRNSQWWKNQLASGVCHYCGCKFPPEALTMDHITPLARGGKSTKGNIVVCCKKCNSHKKYHTPAELLLDQLKNENENDKD
ncbi:HNH endonuclease [candidate division KSB1 bacterium]|nr:HNH endonuclease [candidate division KSB1 bacterium]